VSETVPTPVDEEKAPDLGFGTVVASESRRRLLNHDGSFNVARHGLGLRASLSLYYSLLTMSWPGFLLLLGAAYLLTNAVFGAGYLLLGPGALAGASTGTSLLARSLDAFFFSVHTFSTVGYGNVVPATTAANLVVTLESMVGLFSVALATGLVFARFSRPLADIVFSDRAVIAPYRDITAFEFRIANRRRNQIIELEAKVIFSRMEREGERLVRRFYDLPLERRKVTFFPLSWTIVHPIDDASPLRGLCAADCGGLADAEFLVLLTGMDETFSQAVHARSSYKADEIVWNARFDDVFQHPTATRSIGIDVGRIHDLTRLEDGAKEALRPRTPA
jgi:inward rectifier potassium channel